MSMKPYPEYKDSRIEWLGEMPAHWHIAPIKALCSFNDEVLPENTDPRYTFRYVEISDVSHTDGITFGEPIAFAGAASRARRVVREGDVLVSTVRTYLRAIAGVRSIPSDTIASTGFAVLRPKDCDARFLAYGLLAEHAISEIIARSVGVSYPAINATDLVNVKLPLPDLGEQQAIVDFLDRETAEIDAFITDQEKLISLLAERRTATITRAVTKGLTPGTRMKDSGVPWLGEVPAHWALSKLGHHYEVVLGKMLDGAKEAPIGARVLPYIRAGNIQDSGLDLSDVNEMAYTPYEAERLDLIAKDLLVVEGGSVGTVHYLDSAMGGWSFQKTVNRVRSLGSADTKYLGNLIRTFRDSGVFEVICNGSTIMHLTAEKLRALTIPVPTVDEQRSIAVFIDRETEEIDAAIEEARIAIALSKERRAAVISAAVTGKIDVRDIASRTSTNKVGAESVGVA